MDSNISQVVQRVESRKLKGGVHGSAHVHESKYFFSFARYDPILFNFIRCLRTIQKGIRSSGGIFFI